MTMVVACGSLAGSGLLRAEPHSRRRCELAITEPAILTRAIVPELFEEALSLINRLLPPHHPDFGAGSSATEFQRAREAYETLADPERRRRYDRQLRRLVSNRS